MARNKTLIEKLGLNDLLDFVYPPVCLCCDKSVEESNRLICADCWEKIVEFDFPFCLNCREIVQSGERCSFCKPEEFLPVFALGHYVDPLKEIIHQFKYYGFRKLGSELAERLVNKHFESLGRLKIDCIIPIPLHSFREKSRGFNQAVLLSDIIGKRLGIPLVEGTLVKTRRTRDQAKLDPPGREKNIKGVFRVLSGDLKDKRALIVDDVVTTGATVREAFNVLTDSGTRVTAIATVAVAGF